MRSSILDPRSSSSVALLTPAGVGALAVVRVAGPLVGAFLKRYFGKVARAGRCVHGELRDGDEVIDDPVVALSADGAFADVSLHGGDWIVRRTIELAIAFGFSPSTTIATDEATDAVERDVLASLPSVRTELALRVLLAQPAAWDALRRADDRSALARAAEDVTLANLLRVPRVAIVGEPNVGKSTLANRLFGTDRSIVADLPGTTRDWVGEVADVDGLAVMLVDTPGVRATADAIERRAIELAGIESAAADFVVLILDALPPSPGAVELARRHPDAVVVLNKADRPHDSPGPFRVDVETVATTGAGVDALRGAIAARFGCRDVDPTVARCWTETQRDAVRRRLASV